MIANFLVTDLIDVTVPQSKQSVELLRPFRQPVLTDAHEGGSIMGYHRHPQPYDGAVKAFIPYLDCTAGKQTRDVTFHD